MLVMDGAILFAVSLSILAEMPSGPFALAVLAICVQHNYYSTVIYVSELNSIQIITVSKAKGRSRMIEAI